MRVSLVRQERGKGTGYICTDDRSWIYWNTESLSGYTEVLTWDTMLNIPTLRPGRVLRQAEEWNTRWVELSGAYDRSGSRLQWEIWETWAAAHVFKPLPRL